MAARILDGKQLAENIRRELQAEIETFVRQTGKRPGLAAVLVGDNPASQVYVRNKRRACEQVGIASWLYHLPQETTEAQLLELIGQLNADPNVSGILVQLPLPPQIRQEKVLRTVLPSKDVDGFGPENLGFTGRGPAPLRSLHTPGSAAIASALRYSHRRPSCGNPGSQHNSR
jgi:methylenetetrahydrofolate dehydrogenase (NADP+)/methenyltetrahydrofolate cyclohydrolase